MLPAQRAQALEADRLGHATAWANMSEQQRAQALASDRLRYGTARTYMSEEEQNSINQSTRKRMARLWSQMSNKERSSVNQSTRRRVAQLWSHRILAQLQLQILEDGGPRGRACNCNMDTFDAAVGGIEPNDLGRMEGSYDRKCLWCGAKGFECKMRGSATAPHMGQLCCNQEKIELPTSSPFPIELYKLLTEQTLEAKEF